MSIFTLLYGVGSVSLFSSRAFLTAFMTALMLRLGPDLPILQSTDFLEGIVGAPTWFTQDATLLVLGILAAVEVLATKSPEARALLQDFDQYLKPGMAALTYIGVANATDVEFVEKAVGRAGMSDYLLTLFVVPGVYLLSAARTQVMAFLIESDEDDDLGVQGLISWAEDLGVVGGLVLMILFPILMVVLLGIVAGSVLWIRKRVEVRDSRSKIVCEHCGQMIYPCAVACFACGEKVSMPCAIGMFGQSKQQPTSHLASHPYRLVEKKRCPICATRLVRSAACQDCPACGHKLMADEKFANAYLAHVSRRVPLVCMISFLLSLVPVIGLLPGVIYYRMNLVAPFRRYIPAGRRIVMKWLIRVFFFFLIAFQWVPFLGGFVVPVMAVVNYGGYRAAFRSQLPKT